MGTPRSHACERESRSRCDSCGQLQVESSASGCEEFWGSAPGNFLHARATGWNTVELLQIEQSHSERGSLSLHLGGEPTRVKYVEYRGWNRV
jgi:hypothetical protein